MMIVETILEVKPQDSAQEIVRALSALPEGAKVKSIQNVGGWGGQRDMYLTPTSTKITFEWRL